MKTKVYLNLILTFVAIAILTLIVFLALRPLFNSVLVLVIAFLSISCICFQSASLVDWDSPSWRIIDFCSGWYIRCMGPTFGYAVLFFFHVTGVALVCFVISFVVTMIISPITYLVYKFRN